MRRFLPAILVLAFAFLSLHPYSSFAKSNYTVEKVIDGQTLKLNDGRTIRLLGVDAPQWGNPEKNQRLAQATGIDRNFLQLSSYAAANFLRDLVEGEVVVLSYDPSQAKSQYKDKDGKYLAYVWFKMRYKETKRLESTKNVLGMETEDRLLNSELVRSGYAFLEKENPSLFKDQLKKDETDAKENERGVWRKRELTYEERLEQGRAAFFISTADFVSPEARAIGLGYARQILTQLTEEAPQDYRAFYERSWLGLDPYHKKASQENLSDIDKALLLSPSCMRCQAQKHFILRLLGRHTEAGEAYKRAVLILATNTGVSMVTRQSVGRADAQSQSFIEDMKRASLNEEHFLIFMARYKSPALAGSEPLARAYRDLMKSENAKRFDEKYHDFLDSATPQDILFHTYWSQKGWEDPQKALEAMETID